MMRPFALLLALTLLAGCATRAPGPEEDRQRGAWRDQVQRLERLDSWSLVGKVGLRTPEDATSANLDWQQSPAYYRMLISGPFGSGRSVLKGTAEGVSLTTGEGRFEAASPEALMEEQLGWSLPVSALDHWVRGLPAPGGDYQREEDAQGFPARLRQDGWDIVYRDWTWAEGLWLPRRLIMTHDEIRATLVVNEWRPELKGE